MDDTGRLHMPGFVGKTFEETGVKKPVFGKVASSMITDEIDEAARNQVEGVKLRAAAELGGRDARGAAHFNRGRQFAR